MQKCCCFLHEIDSAARAQNLKKNNDRTRVRCLQPVELSPFQFVLKSLQKKITILSSGFKRKIEKTGIHAQNDNQEVLLLIEK